MYVRSSGPGDVFGTHTGLPLKDTSTSSSGSLLQPACVIPAGGGSTTNWSTGKGFKVVHVPWPRQPVFSSSRSMCSIHALLWLTKARPAGQPGVPGGKMAEWDSTPELGKNWFALSLSMPVTLTACVVEAMSSVGRLEVHLARTMTVARATRAPAPRSVDFASNLILIRASLIDHAAHSPHSQNVVPPTA